MSIPKTIRMPGDVAMGVKKRTVTRPERFAPPAGERTVQEQIDDLSPEEFECFENLKRKWRRKYPKEADLFDDEMILRFAACSPGPEEFNEAAAWKVMKNYDERFLNLTATCLEEQLMTNTLFPVPGLKTLKGEYDVFYMRPSRYFPKETPTETIIDNLGYCMMSMQERSENARDGIGFIANMNDWKMTNFSVDYCKEFMKMLQGKIPVRVRMFLVVNPPGWFGMVWNIMRPMLSKDFREKVHLVPEGVLVYHLARGFEDYLPDEFGNGCASTEDIVKDFIAYRKSVEQES